MGIDRIDSLFARSRSEKRTVLVAYLTVGDPSVEDSYACARAALEAGADMLELGVPFSDPTADGPVIAAASYRAIQNGGSLKRTLEVASRLRTETDAPFVLFSYYNPLISFGAAELPANAAAAGVDALLVVDLPPEEGAELRQAASEAGLAMVPLVAPTTGNERVGSVVAGARGFIYYVSVTGVTGAIAGSQGVGSLGAGGQNAPDASQPLRAAGEAARALGARTGLPVAVGFGIGTPEQARLVADHGVEAVVVGSAIVKAIAAATDTAGRVAAVKQLVGSLRAALDGAVVKGAGSEGR
jgi:tryptophan synthase alpha chain